MVRVLPVALTRLVVVACEQDARAAEVLCRALGRMGMTHCLIRRDIDEARRDCRAGEADVCIVWLPGDVPDQKPAWTAESRAPGGGRVPTLLLAEAVTPAVRRAARRAGYALVAPQSLPPRLLYRGLCGLLQGAPRDPQSASEAVSERPPRAMRALSVSRSGIFEARKLRLQ